MINDKQGGVLPGMINDKQRGVLPGVNNKTAGHHISKYIVLHIEVLCEQIGFPHWLGMLGIIKNLILGHSQTEFVKFVQSKKKMSQEKVHRNNLIVWR